MSGAASALSGGGAPATGGTPPDAAAIDRTTAPVALRTIAMPADTNPNGDIFGGWILAQMDLAGGTHAFYEAQGRVATVAVTAMKFHKPVMVGDEVSCYCVTRGIGRTSIRVHVESWVRRRRRAVEEQVTEGLFTFVAIDAEGLPRPVLPRNDEGGGDGEGGRRVVRGGAGRVGMPPG